MDRQRTGEEWYTEEINTETRNRIRVALAAYAYEVLNESYMTDAEYDVLARKIDLKIDTRRPDLDKWFRENFRSNTGSWVWRHPEQGKLDYILTNPYYGRFRAE